MFKLHDKIRYRLINHIKETGYLIMNEVKMTGTILKDVELNYTKSGKAIAKFMLKVPHAHNPKRSAFVPIQIWGDLAVKVADNAKKDATVSIFGEYETGSYEKKDGTKVYTTNINAWACGTDANKVFNTPRPQPELAGNGGF